MIFQNWAIILLIVFFAIAVGLYICFTMYLYMRQEKILFHPWRTMIDDPSSCGMKFENCEFKTEDGVTLRGWFIPAPADVPKKPFTLLFFHGNAANISHYIETVKLLGKTGCDMLFFNHRGYGNSDNVFPSEKGIEADARAALNYLVAEKKVKSENIIYVGRSMGGSTAVGLAVEKAPRALITESAFASMYAVAVTYYPIFPIRSFLRMSMDNLKRIRDVRVPTLIIHSIQDEVIPYAHSLEIYKHSAASEKEVVTLSGTHNECYFTDSEKYLNSIISFMDSLAAGN